ncbi:hypothetical protein FYG04_16665 [Klebsiella pneumoniae]|nr:hypothetical protein FYG04_16665 [Klebsiella pneumoniae]
MINHSQFCFRGILWFSHKIAPYSVGCPTFGVQSSSAAGRSTLERVLSLCRMAASPYPANGSAGDHRTRRPGKRSAAGQKR